MDRRWPESSRQFRFELDEPSRLSPLIIETTWTIEGWRERRRENRLDSVVGPTEKHPSEAQFDRANIDPEVYENACNLRKLDHTFPPYAESNLIR